MTPPEIQSNAVQTPYAVKVPDARVRRRKQARFFSELRVLKTASRLNADQNEFACQLVNGLQRGDIAVLNRMVADSCFSYEELQGAVAGAQRVFDTCNLIVAIEWYEPDSSSVHLWVRHNEFGSILISAADSQFACADSAQDLVLRAIAERISDFFVMY